MRILVAAYGTAVSDGWKVHQGMTELLENHPDAEVLVPCTPTDYSEDVVRALHDSGRKFTLFLPEKLEPRFRDDSSTVLKATEVAAVVRRCEDPLREALWELGPGDVLATVDDGSERFMEAVSQTEDLGLDIWDLADGLRPVEYDPLSDECDTLAEVQEAMLVLMDAMVHHITHSLTDNMVDRLDETLKLLGMDDEEEEDEED